MRRQVRRQRNENVENVDFVVEEFMQLSMHEDPTDQVWLQALVFVSCSVKILLDRVFEKIFYNQNLINEQTNLSSSIPIRYVTCLQPMRPVRDAQSDPTTRFQMDDVEADHAAAQEDDHASQIRLTNGNVNDVEIVAGCVPDQCPWCGFRDRKRKTRSKCPQHDLYSGTVHEKGAKISPDWVPGNRQSHNTSRRVAVTPLSVVSAPSDPAFKTTNWTEGMGALENFTPTKCLAQKQTRVKPSLGWTVDTPPITLFNHFHTVGLFQS